MIFRFNVRHAMLRDVSLPLGSLAVHDQGDGPVLVLVHGFPLTHAMWKAQIDGLSDQFRVLAPDLRGFGSSTVTAGTVKMDQFADDLAAMLEGLSITERIVLCGLSMGGYIAWQFVRRHPERLRGLILCDTRAAADSPEAREGRWKTAEQVIRLGAPSIAEALQPKLFAARTMEQRQEILDEVRQMILGNDPQGIAAAQRGMAERPDSVSLLGGIAVPTLVLCGQEDRISPPEEMRGIANAIPGARFQEFADAGHMAPMEQPELVNAAIREFLNSLDR